MDWSKSPCSHCPESPCCTYLPLARLRIETKSDLAGTEVLLRHRYFRLGLKDSGEWMLFYNRECSHLDSSSSKCRLFGRKERPFVCVSFTAHPCWYERVFAGNHASESFLLFGPERLARVAELLEYDESDEIALVPSWRDMIEACRSLPWTEVSPGTEEPRDTVLRSFGFKTEVPGRMKHLELFRFRLGFPGIRLGIARDGWYTIVDSEGPADPGLPVPYLFPGGPDIEVGGPELLDRAAMP